MHKILEEHWMDVQPLASVCFRSRRVSRASVIQHRLSCDGKGKSSKRRSALQVSGRLQCGDSLRARVICVAKADDDVVVVVATVGAAPCPPRGSRG